MRERWPLLKTGELAAAQTDWDVWVTRRFPPQFDDAILIHFPPAKGLKYPGHPRDDHGRFDEGKQTITTIDEAVKRLEGGKGVMFERPDQVVTLLHKIGEIVQKAKEDGDTPKVYDLCKVYVGGTNIFCQDNVNIPRSEMPQMSGIPEAGSFADEFPKADNGKVNLTKQFVKHMRSEGLTVEKVKVDSALVRASQNQIDGAKVARILKKYEKNREPYRRFIVSTDHYIVDGHHHWAAQIAYNLERNKPTDIKVFRVSEQILPLLKRANDYANDVGIPRRAVGKAFEGRTCETCVDPEAVTKFNPNHAPAGTPEGGQFISGTAGGAPILTEEQHDRFVKQRDYAKQVASQLGFDSNNLNVIHGQGESFEVGNEGYKMGGFFSPSTGEITLYVDDMTDGQQILGMLSHEIQHDRFNRVYTAFEEERRRIIADARDVIRADGSLRTEYYMEYPVYNSFQKYWELHYDDLKQWDGVTEYSKSYWKASSDALSKVSVKSAINETLAEIARLHMTSESTVEGLKHVHPIWRGFYDEVNRLVKVQKL
jgi:hypothetical protein